MNYHKKEYQKRKSQETKDNHETSKELH